MTRCNEKCLQADFGIKFHDPGLLRQALTHSSYVNERPGEAPESNERLEFLGDAVVGLAIAGELFRRFPDFDEGRLTELRAGLVRWDTMAQLAQGLRLDDYLYLGRGEEASGGRSNRRNLARALEAFVGALSLDQGYDAAQLWTLALFKELLDALPGEATRDYKSLLQETVQAAGRAPPVYRTIGSEGPDHSKDFLVEVEVEPGVTAQGRGSSKRMAQQDAARHALAALARKEKNDAG